MRQPPIDVSERHWELIAGIQSSDLDLAIIGDSPLPLNASAALADDFAESDLPFKVDVVDWATTSESFRTIIAQSKVVVQQAPSP